MDSQLKNAAAERRTNEFKLPIRQLALNSMLGNLRIEGGSVNGHHPNLTRGPYQQPTAR